MKLKKRVFIPIIVVSGLLIVILAAFGFCAIYANGKNDDSEPQAALSDWQSMIENVALVKQIAIPGAHDAGTKGLPYFSATQDRDTADLLKCGTRYLDIRVAYADGALKIYHGPSKGIELSRVLGDVKEFLTAHATESVILDFHHFDEKTDEAQVGAIELVESALGDLLLQNNELMTDAEFIDGLTLGGARGKCIVVWGRENDRILEKPYVFKRNDDGGTRDNSVLHSYYTSELNKKESDEYIKTALPKYLDEYKKINSGLFVLQGQLTDGKFVFGPRFKESTHTENMNEYVKALKDSEDLPYINIVIRDFVSPRKNCLTLALNIQKGIVKPSCAEDFAALVA